MRTSSGRESRQVSAWSIQEHCPGRPVRAGQFLFGLLREMEDVPGNYRLGGIAFAAAVQLGKAKGANRFQHYVPGISPGCGTAHQVEIEQFPNDIDRRGFQPQFPDNLFGNGEVESRRECAEEKERTLELRRQELVAPGDGRMHGALAFGQIPALAGEDLLPVFQLGQHDLG